jgi:glycerophosphoryl diester phosphodiesterase
MLVLAHRGANRLEAENTVPAMAAALAHGADGVELDVHRSVDGALVVHHDAEVRAGPLAQLTRHELQAARPEIPTLDDVLDVCRGALVNVEVKDPDPRAALALVALLDARAAAGSSDHVLVSSFDLATVDLFRASAVHVPTGVLAFGLAPDDALALASARGHAAVHPDVWTLLTVDVRAFVGRAHGQGVKVNVWTVNDAEQVEQLQAAGVDAVITDAIELYAYGQRGGGVTGGPR